MAVANYHELYGSLPPPYLTDSSGRPMHSWRVLLLPFLEQGHLYEQYDFSEPWDGPNNRKLIAQRPSIYAFSDAASGDTSITNYVAVVGDETAWPTEEPLTMDEITDGTGHTLLIVENLGAGIAWTEPRDLVFSQMEMNLEANSPVGISSRFEPAAAVTVDGQLLTLSAKLSRVELAALLTANGGEAVERDGEVNAIPDGRDRRKRD